MESIRSETRLPRGWSAPLAEICRPCSAVTEQSIPAVQLQRNASCAASRRGRRDPRRPSRVAQRDYQRWRSVQDEIFKTLMNAAGRGGRDGEEKPTDTTSHQ